MTNHNVPKGKASLQLFGRLLVSFKMAVGTTIWLTKERKYIVSFFMVFMISFSTVNVNQNTTYIEVAAFIVILFTVFISLESESYKSYEQVITV